MPKLFLPLCAAAVLLSVPTAEASAPSPVTLQFPSISLGIRDLPTPRAPRLPDLRPRGAMSPEKRSELIKAIAMGSGAVAGFAIGLPVFLDGLSLTLHGAGATGWWSPGVLALFRGSPDGGTLAIGIVGVILGAAMIVGAVFLTRAALRQYDVYKQTASRPGTLAWRPAVPGRAPEPPGAGGIALLRF